LPQREKDGLISSETLPQWFSENAAAIQSLLMDKNAPWNDKHSGDGKGETLSPEESAEAVTCSGILKTFGVSTQSFVSNVGYSRTSQNTVEVQA
jgi:hypothetical protein